VVPGCEAWGRVGGYNVLPAQGDADPMLDAILDRIAPPLPDDVRQHLRRATQVNSAGFDPWGLNLETAERALRACRWLYTSYFRVRTHGLETLPPTGRLMVVPNHSGQLPLDGLLIALSLVLDARPPRLVRGMVERWFPSLPFISTLFTRCGQTVGDRENCRELLAREQTILVFPEGVRGTGKTWWDRYQLQHFGTGFVRLAMEAKTPIVPVAVVGAEETYPSIYRLDGLAKLLGVPYVPITPFFPLLGPLGALPLPVQVDLHYGAPILFEGDPDGPDEEIQGHVDRVKGEIQAMLDRGLAARPDLSALSAIPGVGK
jgi:1-acyl-sn-glycerol-3-phosphate acyltransferase